MSKSLLAAVCAFAAVTAFACGDQNQVGNQNVLSKIPSPSPVVPSPSPSPTHVAAPPPPVVQHTTQAPAPAAQTVTLDIITNQPYLSPQNLTISHGSIVRFVNQDAQADKIQIQAGGPGGNTVVNSPTIAPGGTWTYTFSSRGTFGIGDRRPYATDTVNVT